MGAVTNIAKDKFSVGDLIHHRRFDCRGGHRRYGSQLPGVRRVVWSRCKVSATIRYLNEC